MSADYDLKPYRVEWRHGATTWVLAKEGNDSHEEARDDAKAHVDEYGGEARVIVQHVIERVKA